MEPSIEHEAKRARFEVDRKAEAAMKSGRNAIGMQHGGKLAERDEIGMASGQPPGKMAGGIQERKRRRLKADNRRFSLSTRLTGRQEARTT